MRVCKRKISFWPPSLSSLVDHQKKSLEHLFLHSEIAKDVWAHFSSILKKVQFYVSIEHLWHIWCNPLSVRNQTGSCQIAIFHSVLEYLEGKR